MKTSEFIKDVENMGTITKGSLEHDQWMQVTVTAYVDHLAQGGDVDEEFEKEISEFYNISSYEDKTK